MLRRYAVPVGIVMACALCGAAAAETTISTTVAPTITVGNGDTVSVVGGGSVTAGTVSGGAGSNAINVSAGGVLNVFGGSISGGSVTTGGSAVGISQSGGQVNISGGSITGGSVAGGGFVYGLYMTGGTATITGGNLHGGHADITGGGAGAIRAVGGSLTIRGGTIQGGDSVTDGSGAYAIYGSGATISLYGGTVLAGTNSSAKGFYVNHGALNIYGSGFNYAYGSMAAGTGTLTGTLSDGSALNTTYELLSSGSYNGAINLIYSPVPEPSSAALLALGGIALLTRRRT